MKTFVYTVGLAAFAIMAANCSDSEGQPFAVRWEEPGAGDWNDGSNWEDIGFGNNVPQADFAEFAVISNGGTAQVTTTGPTGPPPVGGVDAGPGTLEILSGGTLVVEANANVDGTVDVLSSGTLSVASGGTLTAQAVANSGTVRTIGPTAGFNIANNFSMGSSSALVAEITTATHSAISVGGTAALGGNLNVLVSGATPSPGDSWNVLDASDISGGFRTITSAGAGLGPGQVFGFRQQAGGNNGTLGQVFVDQRLVLSVDRETGVASITNPGAAPIAIDGYTVQSAVGSINPGGWFSLDEQGFDGDSWSETGSGGTPNALAELKPSGTSAFGASASIGSIFQPNFVSFGQETEDLTFSYTMPGFDTIEGAVNYVGDKQFNNLVLTVDPDTGEATIQNESALSVAFDGYTITSESEALLPGDGNWQSLQDQGAGGGDWYEVETVDSSLLGELQAGEVTTLNQGDGFHMGAIFDTAKTQDLVFEFLREGEWLPFTGVVVYGELPTLGGFAADFNGDGKVDGVDLPLWETAFGVSDGADADADDDSDGYDFLIWQREFGSGVGAGSAAVAAAVPEPGTLSLGVIAGLLLSLLCPARRH